jgi:hypothetical protein
MSKKSQSGKSKKKISNPSTPIKLLTKKVSWDHPIYQWRVKPVSEQYLADIASDIIEQSKSDENFITIEQFLKERNISWQTLKRWREKYELLDQAIEFAKMCIGIRLQIGGFKNQLNAGMVQYILPHYSKIWHDVTEWRASLKQPIENQGSTIVIDKPCYNSCCSKEKKI